MKKLTAILGIPAIAGLMFGASLASAQPGGQQGGQGGQQGAPPQGQQQAPDISDETRQNFLEAYPDIIAIQNDYAEQLENAEGQEEAMELQQQAQEEMQQAVQDNGMTVEEYNRAMQAASSDPELRSALQEAAGQSGGGQGGQSGGNQ